MLDKFDHVSPSQFREIIEGIAADTRRKSGAPPVQNDPVKVFLCEMVEIAKDRGVSDRRAFQQVEEYSKAVMAAARRRAVSDPSSPFDSYYCKALDPKSFSFDQIKRAYAWARGLPPDARNELLYSSTYSSFKRFLDDQEAKPARPKTGAETPRI